MNEADQIYQLLRSAEAETFWEEDKCNGWSVNAPGGMSVSIGQKGPVWTWAVVRPDGSRRFSPGSFPTVRQAKADLRSELEQRRREIIDRDTGPAGIS